MSKKGLGKIETLPEKGLIKTKTILKKGVSKINTLPTKGLINTKS